MSSPTTLRRAFVDVCRGYSVARRGDQDIYIRHLSHKDHQENDLLEESFRAHAIAQRGSTEAQRIALLTAEGKWSPEKDTAIERQRDYIARLVEGRKTIIPAHILKSQDEQIAREKDTLVKMLTERAELVGMTVESYAANLLEEYYLRSNLFVDPSFTKTYFTLDEYNYMDNEEVKEIETLYRRAIEPCSDENLRRLAVQDFFVSYYCLCNDDASSFYGRPVCDLTYYQVKLMSIARYMKGIMENTEMSRLTPAQRADPDALINAHQSQKSTAAIQARGEVPVNMSAADLKATGLDKQMTKLPDKPMSGLELVKHLQKNQGPR